MNGHLDIHRIQIHAHQARMAESAPPARVRSVVDPRWRRVVATVGRGAHRAGGAVRRILVLPEPGPSADAPPAMLGRHARPNPPAVSPSRSRRPSVPAGS